jgi:hypothetical protein
MDYKKKLIEVALPLESINQASLKEKNPFLKGHPRAIHLWWARRPLVAARAIIFAPRSCPSNPGLAIKTLYFCSVISTSFKLFILSVD